MGIFSRKQKDFEQRTETAGEVSFEDVLLQSLLGTTQITKTQALSIPAVQGCIKFAADTVSMLPIKLYKEKYGKVEEVKDDPRVRILNDDTGDTLDAVQFWRAIVADYYLGKGGYGYINKNVSGYESLHYVDEINLTTIKNTDPIFKDYDILINANQYKPYEFLKILRNTKDGAQGKSIIEESPLILSVAYNSLVFEETLVKKGGNKKGFLESVKKVSTEAMTELKRAFKLLYGNNEDNVVVLNEGITFKEASQSSVEMQLNENKGTNSSEICKLFLFPVNVINGNATEKEYNNAFKLGIMPLLTTIKCALNRDFLLENEKTGEEVFYWDFDTKELLKGSIKERYEAYGLAIDKGFMKIDEVRYMEDKEPFDIDWINVGLNSVLYDTKTKEVYTPNTDKVSTMKEKKAKKEGDIIES